MWAVKFFAVAALVASAAPVSAQLRSLDVPDDKGWQHARTGLILMGRLGEYQRSDLKDNGREELDVSATYRSLDGKSTATLYLYRPGVYDLPMWFDRSHTAMTLNREIKLGQSSSGVARFAPPGRSTQSALRIAYPFSGQVAGASGLAMIPFGEWLVAIRLTSDTMSVSALDAALSDLIAKIRWPAKMAEAKLANPVRPCASPLKYKRAKLVQPDLAQALMSSVLGNAMRDVAKKDPARAAPSPDYCLDQSMGPPFSAYRAADSRSAYVMAIGDAGVAATIAPEFSLSGETGRYGVTLEDWDSSDSYPSFNAMPSPQQVMALLQGSRPVASAGRGNNTISVSPPAK